MKGSISTVLFFRIILIFSIICLNCEILHAQSGIIQIQRDCVISAEASNLFPKLNEAVSIKVKIRAPIKLVEGKSVLYFALEDGIDFLSGQKSFKGNLDKDKTITLEIKVKFTERKVYYVNYNLRTREDSRLVDFTFYVDGGFRESIEVIDLRKAITEQKYLLNRARTDKTINLDQYLASYHFAGNNIHTIYTHNEFEQSDTVALKQNNIELFGILKKEFDSLWTVAYNLFLQRKNSDLERNKKALQKDKSGVSWENR